MHVCFFTFPCRFSLKHDSDGEGAPVDFKDFNREKNRVKKVSDSESDSDGERDKRREREREERRKKKSPLDMMMEKKRENEGGMKDRGRDKDKKEDRKPKYYRDIKPVKILGVTTEPGDLHFYVEWDSGVRKTFSLQSKPSPPCNLSPRIQFNHSFVDGARVGAEERGLQENS